MFTISGDPSQQSRTREKTSQTVGKAETYGRKSQADSWEPLQRGTKTLPGCKNIIENVARGKISYTFTRTLLREVTLSRLNIYLDKPFRIERSS
jgi:hypothetical protein